MADKFCTKCGGRLSDAVRFCSSCGSPVEEGMEEAVPAAVKDMSFFDRLKENFQGPGSIRADEEKCVTVLSRDLDTLAAYSFMSMPLDTQFLLVRNERQNWTKWVPILLITNMQGLKTMATAWACSDFSRQPCASDRIRHRVLPEASTAFAQVFSTFCLYLKFDLHYRPAHYGELEVMRGKWVTCLNNGSKTYTPMTLTPVPMSGQMMKRRMAEHEAWINRVMPSSDEEGRKYLAARLENLRSAMNGIPDGWPDHVSLVASMAENRKFIHTVLAEEDGSAQRAAVREDAFRRVESIALQEDRPLDFTGMTDVSRSPDAVPAGSTRFMSSSS